MKRTRRTFDILSILLFVMVVAVPVYGLFFRDAPPPEENRKLYPYPIISTKRYVWQSFPKQFEMWLGDHIGYRDVLLNWHSRMIYGVFDQPVTTGAWIGRDGWLFLTQPVPKNGPNSQERVESWAAALAERHEFLRSRNIEYLVVIAPDKSSVYPEYLRGYPQRHPTPETGTALTERLTRRGVTCVNLLPTLLAAKGTESDLVYFKTDTHWTPSGARVGYSEMARAIGERFPDYRPRPIADYRVREHRETGDLRKMAGVPDDAPREVAATFEPNLPVDQALGPDYSATGTPSRISTQATASGPRTILLHDSFGGSWIPFFQTDFRRALFISTYGFPPAAIVAEQPKLVVQLIVARQLYTSLPPLKPEK